MSIPALTAEGVLPPFVGPSGAAASSQNMSPYFATALEVVTHFGGTPSRQSILQGWLNHRAGLRSVGFDRGFQWLDGSFVENKNPNDLDVVTYLNRPQGILNAQSLLSLRQANLHLFERSAVRANFRLDFFSFDLDGSPEALVQISSYFIGLFSHRRGDQRWKGMLQVRLEDPSDDQAALAALGSTSAFSTGDVE